MLTESYEDTLRKFVDSTASYKSVANAVARHRESVRHPAMSGAPGPAAPAQDGTGDGEEHITFRMDVQGHVMVCTTEDQKGKMSDAVIDLFSECGVLLAAVTAALASKSKSLYDYDSVRQVLMGSGDFVSLQISDRDFHSTDSTVMLDTAVIAEVMGAFVGIEALEAASTVMSIAKNVVSGVGSKLTAEASQETGKKKMGHLLFICQDLMGAPLVSVSYFYSSFEESVTKIKTPCASTVSTSVDFKYHQEDFMFVSPAAIAKYSPELTANKPEYEKLIAKLTALIT